MTDFERFAAALAKTESDDSELAWGDAKEPEGKAHMGTHDDWSWVKGAKFMAAGRWQMHPTFVHDYIEGAPAVGESWDEWFRSILEKFYKRHRGLSNDMTHLAMVFHLGLHAVHQGKW